MNNDHEKSGLSTTWLEKLDGPSKSGDELAYRPESSWPTFLPRFGYGLRVQCGS
jgi:hypothetical protein